MTTPLDEDHLESAEKFHDNTEEMMRNYKDWKKSIKDNSVFDDKIRELLGLAAASAAECRYCVHIHGQKALKRGAMEEEVSQVVQIASQVSAGAAMSHGLEALECSED
jgi:AhpD family alkylhydroperoxidase